jgi:hypothetical protein
MRKAPGLAAGDGKPWEGGSTGDGENATPITSPAMHVDENLAGGRVAVVDIEARSLLDIKNVGAAKWIEHDSTEPHCVGYVIDDQPAKVWRIRIRLYR